MAEELRLLPVQLTAYRKQAQIFWERILDIDQVGREVRTNMREAYLFDCPGTLPSFVLSQLPSALESSEAVTAEKSYTPTQSAT